MERQAASPAGVVSSGQLTDFVACTTTPLLRIETRLHGDGGSTPTTTAYLIRAVPYHSADPQPRLKAYSKTIPVPGAVVGIPCPSQRLQASVDTD